MFVSKVETFMVDGNDPDLDVYVWNYVPGYDKPFFELLTYQKEVMGLKTSPNYDYSDPTSIAQKEIDDEKWIDQQMELRGFDPIHRLTLRAK